MLNCVRATHGLPADRGPSVPWVSLPGPTGVPTDTQAGWYQGQSANPLAAATAETDATAACVCMRVRVRSTLDMLSQTHSLDQMYADVDFDRFGLYCDAPHIFNCTRAQGFASRPATKEICDFGMTPVKSSSLVPTSTSNESFQIRSPTSVTLVPTSSALVPDSQFTVAIDRGEATTVLSELVVRIEQRKRFQRHLLSLRMFAVCLVCVLRATFVHARRSSQSRFS